MIQKSVLHACLGEGRSGCGHIRNERADATLVSSVERAVEVAGEAGNKVDVDKLMIEGVPPKSPLPSGERARVRGGSRVLTGCIGKSRPGAWVTHPFSRYSKRGMCELERRPGR